MRSLDKASVPYRFHGRRSGQVSYSDRLRIGLAEIVIAALSSTLSERLSLLSQTLTGLAGFRYILQSMQASKHFHKFQEVRIHLLPTCTQSSPACSTFCLLQKYASMHTARNDGKTSPPIPLDMSSSPVSNKQRAEQNTNSPPAAAHKTASTCQRSGTFVSGKSESCGRPAPVHKQRKRRHETPAALADPLGAFACQATQRQRTLQSGLSLLKGKTSQPRVVAHNLRPPSEPLPAQLDTYRFQAANTAAQPATQPIKGNNRKNEQHLQEHTPQEESQDRIRQCGHQQSEIIAKSKEAPPAKVHPPGPSWGSISHNSAPDLMTASRQANTNYFQDIKRSICTLVQVNHTIPSLHAMSDTDKAALTSMLTNKLDGVNILSDLQHHFTSKAGPAEPAEPPAEQQPSAASSVDCTPSPDSVTQRDTKPHKLPKLSLPHQHARPRALPFVDASYTSHALATSLGSGHKHAFASNDNIDSRPSGHRQTLTASGVINSRFTAADSDGCINSRLTAADLRSTRQRHAVTGNGITNSRLTVVNSDVGLLDLHAEPKHTNCSLGQYPGWSYSRESNAMSLDAEAAAACDSPMIEGYASVCQTA